MSRLISRRDVLLGGAALGLGGALGAAGLASGVRRVSAAAQPLPLPRHRRVGATFDLFPFPAGTTYSQAVDMWNATTGTTMHCWKVYYHDNEIPTPAQIANDDKIQTIISRGIEALISFRPVPPGSPPSTQAQAQLQALHDALVAFKSSGLVAQVCLYQEVGPSDLTATQYQHVVSYYGPTVRQFYPLVFDAPGSQGLTVWREYDPGQDQLDGYAIDFYCSTFVHDPTALDDFAGLAGNLPIGIWEIGNTATDSFMPSPTQLADYMNTIRSFLSNRIAAGLPVGDVAWYNGPAAAGQLGQNEIVGTNPNPLAAKDIVHYDALYAAIDDVG